MKSGIASAIVTIVFFAYVGGVTLFFVGGLLFGWLKVLPVFGSFNNWIVFSFSVGIFLGGFTGYLIYRKFRDKDE
jgi:hypothetical protein